MNSMNSFLFLKIYHHFGTLFLSFAIKNGFRFFRFLESISLRLKYRETNRVDDIQNLKSECLLLAQHFENFSGSSQPPVFMSDTVKCLGS